MTGRDKNISDSGQPAAIIAALLLVLFFVAGIMPIYSMWGFNLLLYFSNQFILFLLILTLLMFIPAIAGVIYRIAQSVGRIFSGLPFIARIIIVATLAFLAFYFFRVHVHALGDGYQRVYQIEKGYLNNPPEPLDFFLHSISYIGLNLITKVSAEKVYTSYSIIMGILFILAVFLFRFPDKISRSAANMSKIMIVGFGGLQVFFGYVESYSLLYFAAILFVMYAYRFLTDGTGLITASIFFALAILSHLTGLLLMPAFAYLIYYNNTVLKPATFKEKTLPILLGAIPIGILIGLRIHQYVYYPEFQKGLSDMLLPFYASGDYSMISPTHLFDIINEALLISPILFIILPLLLKSGPAIKEAKNQFRFLAIVAISALLFIFMVDPKLGFARDWDLFAMPMALIGAVVVLAALSAKYLERLSKYIKVILLFGTLLISSVWILLNSYEIKQLQRAEQLLSISDRNRPYAIELLAHYYWQIVDNKYKALQLYYDIDEDKRGGRVYDKITQLEFKLGNYDKTIMNAVKGLAIDSERVGLHLLAGAAYKKLNEPIKSLQHLKRAQQLSPRQANIYSYLGNTYIMMDSLDHAVAAHKMSIMLDPTDPIYYFNVCYTYIQMGQYDSAQVYLNGGIKLEPNYAKAPRYLQMIRQGRQALEEK